MGSNAGNEIIISIVQFFRKRLFIFNANLNRNSGLLEPSASRKEIRKDHAGYLRDFGRTYAEILEEFEFRIYRKEKKRILLYILLTIRMQTKVTYIAAQLFPKHSMVQRIMLNSDAGMLCFLLVRFFFFFFSVFVFCGYSKILRIRARYFQHKSCKLNNNIIMSLRISTI